MVEYSIQIDLKINSSFSPMETLTQIMGDLETLKNGNVNCRVHEYIFLNMVRED